MKTEKKSIKILLIVLLILGFFYRIYGLSGNYSFWSDENPVAIFTRAIFERGKPILANGYFTKDQQFQYWLSAISAKIFGLNEFAIRFPSVIFGVLTISAVYLLGKELFDKNVGLISAFLITFLNIEILWSRQARPYQSLQFLYLLGVYFIYRAAKENKFKWSCFLGFLGCAIFASLMHGLGLVVFFFGFVYLLIFKTPWFKKKWMLLGIFFFILFGWIFRVPIFFVFSQIGKIKNLFYYRVFLVHNYLPLVLFCFLGFYFLLKKKKAKELVFFVLVLGLQTFAVSFLFPQPFTRYYYPILPFIILLASYGIWEIGEIFFKKIKDKKSLVSILLIFLVVFSLWKSDKLSLFPKKIYSLNADMQEIPEVDWKKIYKFVGEKLEINPQTVFLANWNDLPVWYLGEKKLNYLIRKNNQKKVDLFSGASIIGSFEGFQKIMSENKKGILVLDSWDDAIPDGVKEYCQKNLKVEFEIDRLYPVQPRYWTVWVYSWGY